METFSRVYGNERGHLGGRIGKEFNNIANAGKVKLKQEDIYDGETPPAAPPEGNPTAYEHALQSVTLRIDELTGLRHGAEYSLTQLRVAGKYYQYSQKKGRDIWGKSKTDTGYYSFYFEPCFYGIPCPANGLTGYMAADYASDEAMSLVLFFTEGKQIEYADVPLLSFEEVRAALESAVQSGRLRAVESMRLCYAPFPDPKDPDKYWLLPVWQVYGLYAESAGQELKASPGGQGALCAENPSLLYVMGQDGRLVEDSGQLRYGSGDIRAAIPWESAGGKK